VRRGAVWRTHQIVILLEENPADPQLRMNEPGVGYRIVEPPA
jgi:hypothetical protein